MNQMQLKCISIFTSMVYGEYAIYGMMEWYNAVAQGCLARGAVWSGEIHR